METICYTHIVNEYVITRITLREQPASCLTINDWVIKVTVFVREGKRKKKSCFLLKGTQHNLVKSHSSMRG